jgi:hypothetical protein
MQAWGVRLETWGKMALFVHFWAGIGAGLHFAWFQRKNAVLGWCCEGKRCQKDVIFTPKCATFTPFCSLMTPIISIWNHGFHRFKSFKHWFHWLHWFLKLGLFVLFSETTDFADYFFCLSAGIEFSKCCILSWILPTILCIQWTSFHLFSFQNF